MIFRPVMKEYKLVMFDGGPTKPVYNMKADDGWSCYIGGEPMDCSTWNEGIARNLARVILK